MNLSLPLEPLSCFLHCSFESLPNHKLILSARALFVIMSDDVSQPPVLVPKARLLPSSRASDLPQCQEVPWKQTVTDAHSHQSASPRIPASVKLPARSTQTSEARQEMAIAPADGSPGEGRAQRSCQTGVSIENERDRRRRHQQEDSTRHHSRDPEKAYSEQTPRPSNMHSPSRSYDRRIQYEIDDSGDGNTPEEHSVWILVSSSRGRIRLVIRNQASTTQRSGKFVIYGICYPTNGTQSRHSTST